MPLGNARIERFTGCPCTTVNWVRSLMPPVASVVSQPAKPTIVEIETKNTCATCFVIAAPPEERMFSRQYPIPFVGIGSSSGVCLTIAPSVHSPLLESPGRTGPAGVGKKLGIVAPPAERTIAVRVDDVVIRLGVRGGHEQQDGRGCGENQSAYLH